MADTQEHPSFSFRMYGREVNIAFNFTKRDAQVAVVILVVSVIFLYNFFFNWFPYLRNYWKSWTESKNALRKLETFQRHGSRMILEESEISVKLPDVKSTGKSQNDDLFKPTNIFRKRLNSNSNEEKQSVVKSEPSTLNREQTTDVECKPSIKPKNVLKKSTSTSQTAMNTSAANQDMPSTLRPRMSMIESHQTNVEPSSPSISSPTPSGSDSSSTSNPWARYALPSAPTEYISSSSSSTTPVVTNVASQARLQEDLRLRLQQDEEYRESVRRDQMRLTEQSRLDRIKSEEEAQSAALLSRWKQAADVLGSGPEAEAEGVDGGVITVLFHCKNVAEVSSTAQSAPTEASKGKDKGVGILRIKRRFLTSNTVNDLLDFVDSQVLLSIIDSFGLSPIALNEAGVQVYRAYPGTELLSRQDHGALTLRDMGFFSSESLRIVVPQL